MFFRIILACVGDNVARDVELFSENPSEYANKQNDIIKYQMSNYIPSSVSTLLLLYAERIDGQLSYICSTVLSLTKFLVQNPTGKMDFGAWLDQNPEIMPANERVSLLSSNCVQKLDKELLFDTCL